VPAGAAVPQAVLALEATAIYCGGTGSRLSCYSENPGPVLPDYCHETELTVAYRQSGAIVAHGQCYGVLSNLLLGRGLRLTARTGRSWKVFSAWASLTL